MANITRYTQRLTGGQLLHALIGGFHLNAPLFEPLIARILDDLAELSPNWLVPAHCTDSPKRHATTGSTSDPC